MQISAPGKQKSCNFCQMQRNQPAIVSEAPSAFSVTGAPSATHLYSNDAPFQARFGAGIFPTLARWKSITWWIKPEGKQLIHKWSGFNEALVCPQIIPPSPRVGEGATR